MRRLWVFAVGLAGLFCAGCGSGGSSSTGNTGSFRFVQASTAVPQVNLLVDGKTQASNLNYSNATDYLTLQSGSRHVQVVPVSGSTTAILDKTVSIASSGNQTLIMTGTSGGSSTLLTDGGTTAVTGDIYVRVVNASNTMGPADVYIVPAGTSIVGVTPVASSLGFNTDTGYQLVAQGAYEVLMTVPGTSKALLSTGPINPLNSAQDQTVVALDGPGGGFTFTALVDQ